jgi:hypothetical protein
MTPGRESLPIPGQNATALSPAGAERAQGGAAAAIVHILTETAILSIPLRREGRKEACII